MSATQRITQYHIGTRHLTLLVQLSAQQAEQDLLQLLCSTAPATTAHSSPSPDCVVPLFLHVTVHCHIPFTHMAVLCCVVCCGVVWCSWLGASHDRLASHGQESNTDTAVRRCQAAAANATHMDQPRLHSAAHTAGVGVMCAVVGTAAVASYKGCIDCMSTTKYKSSQLACASE